MSEYYRRANTCRLCGGRRLELVLELTPIPLANAFVGRDARAVPQPLFPLDVFFCRECTHVQLLDVIDPRILFEDYPYVSGTSSLFAQHFERYAARVVESFDLEPGQLAVDIGSNDGTLLAQFKARGLRVLGVDPAKHIARRATEAGIETIAEFFTPELADSIVAHQGPAAIVTANNVFAHVDDLAGFRDGVKRLLVPGGVFVFEVSYLVDLVEKALFDMIYHEHLAYHRVKPLQPFFDAGLMELFAVERVAVHGGSLRGMTQIAGGPHKVDDSVAALIDLEERVGVDRAETLRDLARRIHDLGDDLKRLVSEIKARGQTIAGVGAPAKATTLMYHFGIGPEIIDFIVDDSPFKQGRYTPGHHIPVLPASALYDRRPDYAIVLAWNFAASIMEKHSAFRRAGGRFIIPLPTLQVH